jgi:hypothetical protein
MISLLPAFDPLGTISGCPRAGPPPSTRHPALLRPNNKTINLSPGQVTKISDGYALLSDSAGNPLMDFNPSGDTFFF